MGVVGVVLVAIWGYGLLRDSSRILLDAERNAPVVKEIQEVIAASPSAAEIFDLHVWRVGKRKYACFLSLQSTIGEPEYFKQQLRICSELAHITVEVNT